MFNSLWPSDNIWRHGSGSTLGQVVACCLMAPSHYLNQCWPPISEILWLRAMSHLVPKLLLWMIYLKIKLSKSLPHLPEANELILTFRLFPFSSLGVLLRRRCPHSSKRSLPSQPYPKHWRCHKLYPRKPPSHQGSTRGPMSHTSPHSSVSIHCMVLRVAVLQCGAIIRCLSGKLWYLQHNCVGDAIVYH